MQYLNSTELNQSLVNSVANKELYFQDVALFPAFLLLSPEELALLPLNIGLTPIFEVTKKMIRLTLPGASWSGAGKICPIGMQLQPHEIAPYLGGFGDDSYRSILGISYALYDDISSDRFIIMPTGTTLSSLNDLYTGSHRLTPVNVIKSLKRIGDLLANITISNTASIPDPAGPVTPPPPPQPSGPVNTITVLGRLWQLSRGMQSTGPVLNIIHNAPSTAVLSDYTSQPEIDAIENELTLRVGFMGFLTGGRLSSFMGSTTMVWDVTR